MFITLSPSISIAQETEIGHFYHLSPSHSSSENASSGYTVSLGEIPEITRWVCHFREEPFWMIPKTGISLSDVPAETQFLLGELADGQVIAIIPLINDVAVCSLRGGALVEGKGTLELCVETADRSVAAGDIVGVFIAQGDDPYTLLPLCAQQIRDVLQRGTLRQEKPLPDWVDTFGWCTWDAFYQEVSHEKVREGLASFQSSKTPPRFLILDDGWQSLVQKTTGEKQLSAFAANDKFPGGLRNTVAMCKSEFDIEKFFVWHAVMGYWGGTDADSFPDYDIRNIPRTYFGKLKEYEERHSQWFGRTNGTISPLLIAKFYQDYHTNLRREGVDGVKIDNQASLEGFSETVGGRSRIMAAYREGMESSVARNFDGSLINCMSCSSEMLYDNRLSPLTRTSTDFWPNRPESHGLHLWTNAQVSLWWGEWIHPDWDMFQSGHAAGSYHAAGRAVSGSPVYVSDKPGGQDFGVLEKLVTPHGRVLRCPNPGRPTRDMLFADPTQEPVLLKIANLATIYNRGMLGIFHAKYEGESGGDTLSGTFSPSDIPDLEQTDQYAVYRHTTGEFFTMGYEEKRAITLSPLGWEVVTFAAISTAFPVVGVTNKNYLAGANAIFAEYDNELSVSQGGTYVLHCTKAPLEVVRSLIMWEGEVWKTQKESLKFTYEATNHRLEVEVPDIYPEPSELEVIFAL